MTSFVTEHGHLPQKMALVVLTILSGIRSTGYPSQVQLLIAFRKYWDGSSAGPKYQDRLEAAAVVVFLPGKTQAETSPSCSLSEGGAVALARSQGTGWLQPITASESV